MAKSGIKPSPVVFTGCIFVDMPAACCWWREGRCVALDNIPIQLVDCATNHRHIVIRDEAKDTLRHLWEIVISTGRYKKTQGQEGREEAFKNRDNFAEGRTHTDG